MQTVRRTGKKPQKLKIAHRFFHKHKRTFFLQCELMSSTLPQRIRRIVGYNVVDKEAGVALWHDYARLVDKPLDQEQLEYIFMLMVGWLVRPPHHARGHTDGL